MNKICIEKGYIHNEANGKLESYEPVIVRAMPLHIAPSKWGMEIEVEAKVAGVPTMLRNPVVYRDSEYFKKHQPIGFDSIYLVLNENLSGRARVSDLEEGVWLWKNGKAVNTDISELRFLWKAETNLWELHLPEGAEKVYATEEDAYVWNDLHIKEADGTERVEHCLAHYLAMTPEQKNLLGEFLQAKKKLHDAGVGVVAFEDTLYAFNYLHLDEEGIKNSYNETFDESKHCWMDCFLEEAGSAEYPYCDGEFFAGIKKEEE